MTYLLGLTGSIGMGKSTTAQMFRDEGVLVWDADAVVHALYRQGGDAIPAFLKQLPQAIIDGAVSRSALKSMIEDDLEILRIVEGIVHPLVANDRAKFIDKHNNQALLVFDIPLLYETGADSWLDAVAVVTTDLETQKARVFAREGMTAEQFALIQSRQLPDDEKCARADFLIPSDTLDGARAAVQHTIKAIKAGRIDA